jgi:peptide/nickel transport system permease protein
VSLSINFFIPRLVPGSPIEIIIAQLSYQGQKIGSENLIAEYKRMFGLDKDIMTQFICYLKEVFKGNLGYSIVHFPTTVNELIISRLPWTIGLLFTTTVVSWSLGNLLGVIVGWRGVKSKLGSILLTIPLILGVLPYYLLAVILVFLLAYLVPLFPMSGGYSPTVTPGLTLSFILDILYHSILPALSIILSSLGWWFISARSLVTVIKGEDFILMAEAKGLPKRIILWKYAFRNTILPQFTGLTLSLGNIFGGALLTEMVFTYPGIGWLLYHAIVNSDYPTIQGIITLIVVSLSIALLLMELLYPLVDPRIKGE